MKFLIVGLGSMGRRRIRCLTRLQAGAIAGYDPRADRLRQAAADYGIATFETLEAALDAFQPDALVVASPPDQHNDVARQALDGGRHVFCEAGVSTDGMAGLIAAASRSGKVAAPSCTMRFQPTVKRIKALVDGGAIGRVLAYTHHCGQYL